MNCRMFAQKRGCPIDRNAGRTTQTKSAARIDDVLTEEYAQISSTQIRAGLDDRRK